MLKLNAIHPNVGKDVQQSCTGGPRYMQKIGTVKYDSHMTNSHIKGQG